MARFQLLRWTTLASTLFLATSALRARDDAKPWEAYINSPTSRTISPKSIKAISGDAVIYFADDGGYILNMHAGSQISLDFGYVGGWLSMNTETSSEGLQFSLAFAESPSYVRAISDDTGSIASQDYDKALNVTVPTGSYAYTVPIERFRGGFKYVTVHAFQDVTISDMTCALGYSPSQEDPSEYAGHFYTPEDDTLVRIWYAGVFTAQTNIATPNTGRWLPQVKNGWAYNNSLGIDGPMILDGAKRDRAVWPGDLGIAGTTAFLGLGHVGLESVYYSIENMFFYQNKTTGLLPYAGPSTNSFRNGAKSDTYHSWTLIACYNYAIFTGDLAWLDASWANITAGTEYIMGSLDEEDGMHKQLNDNDWARLGGGGYNSALNALDYHVLSTLSSLAADTATEANGRAAQAESWGTAADKLKASFNRILWDSSVSLFRDNETAAGALLFPQDGNALAVLYNLTTSPSQAAAVSTALIGNWNAIGPVTPELPDTISSFISSIEVLAHYVAGKPATALALMRRTWGYMLDSPLMTGTTLNEGMSSNGSLYYRSMRAYNYDAAYTSLSHSWSTGPTQALSFKAVGLEIVSLGRWVFRPQPGDLTQLRTGYVSPLGDFEAVLDIKGKGAARTVDAVLVTPEGLTGKLELPWVCAVLLVNGVAWEEGDALGAGRTVIHGEGCRLVSC